MIIPALIRRYDHLASNPGSGIAPKGYSEQQVSFKVVITKRGELHDIEPVFIEVPEPANRSTTPKKAANRRRAPDDSSDGPVVKLRRRPERMLLPGQSKPPGIGINPCTLWDNAAYMLGFKSEDPKPERTREAFEAYQRHHADLAAEVDDDAVRAVARFLLGWKPSDARRHKHLADLATNFGVFQIRGEEGFVHDRPAFKRWWVARQQSTEAVPSVHPDLAISLTDGQLVPIARIHEPKIKGVAGAQSTGATLVSFNTSAMESFGKQQGAIAPLASDDAFKYCTALNALTTDDRFRVRIAGDTYVFWSEPSDEAEDDRFLALLQQTLNPSGSSQTVNEEGLRAILSQVRQGQCPPELGPPARPFYVLGLSPNIARVSVRIWLASTVQEMAHRLAAHFADLSVEPAQCDAQGLSIRKLVAETAPPSGGFADEGRVRPNLAAELLMSVLTGRPYPHALLTGVLQRARIEGLADSERRKDYRDAQHRRCSIIRACLTRNFDLEVPVALDSTRTDTPYLLGRLFAALERIQENALGQINRTIKDSYYGSASCTPAAVFPRLLSLSRHHLNKIDSTGQRITREKELSGIMSGLTAFPTALPTQGQGLFAIGYFHQRQSYFAKHADEVVSSAN